MSYFLINRDGKPIGFADNLENGIGALTWFAQNVRAYSMNHATAHEGYTVEHVDGLDCNDVAPLLAAIAERIGLVAVFEFVPFSESRNAPGTGSLWESLNWRVRLSRGAAQMETDYAQGVGHAPANKLPSATVWDRNRKRAALAHEIETGRQAKFMWSESLAVADGGKPIAPPPVGDVLHSLAREAEVLDAGGFENWASEYGLDTDSRKAEAVYRTCLEQVLAFRRMVGDNVLTEMRLVAQFN